MSDAPAKPEFARRVEALIDARRKTETDDVIVEIRDALWLAQYATFPERAETPDPQKGQPGTTAQTTESNTPPPTQPATDPAPKKPAAGPAENERTDLFSGQLAGASGESRKASRVRTPAASALPNALSIERALRPFRTRKPSRRARLLDEEATVRNLAESHSAGVNICVPSFRSGYERWFDLALIVDAGAEMTLWHRTINDLRRLLGRQDAFSDARAWTLTVNTPETFRLRNNAGSLHPLNVLRHPAGRRLVLILTQGTGPHWQSEKWQAELEDLATNTPVGIVQFLPDSLWPYTRLGPTRRHASSRLPGLPNHRLSLAATWEDSLTAGERLVPFPVLTLDPASIANWAGAVMARKGGISPCLLLGRTAAAPAAAAQDIDPETRVERFRSIAPPNAFRLACHFAAVPLTLPVMRIIREAMVPQAAATDIGAVLASGLLRVAGPAEDPEMTFFEFLPGVDEVLRESLRRGEERRTYASVRDEIRRFLENQIGRQLPEDFSYVFDEEGAFELSATARSFVDLNRKTLERLGHQKPALTSKTRFPGLEVHLFRAGDHPNTSMLFDVLERSLVSSGYQVARVTELAEDKLIVEVLTRPSGALVSVTAPQRSGRPFNFSNQRRWAESYRELVDYIDSTQDEPGALYGVPALPRPRIERTALENALRYRLGWDAPVRVNLTGPPFSGKRVVMAAVARHPLTRRTFRGGIFWEQAVAPESPQPGSRLFIEPDTGITLRPEDAAVWFDDRDFGSAFEVEPLSRPEADRYFLDCGGEQARPWFDALWETAKHEPDECAWLGLALREFPGQKPPDAFEDFFPWLLNRLETPIRDSLRQLAVLRPGIRIPDPLVAALIPNESVRAELYSAVRTLCLLQREDDGWWPVISPASEALLQDADLSRLHAAIVAYYAAAQSSDPYYQRHYPRHCHLAGRQDEVERFFNDPDILLARIRTDGWEHLAAELRGYGLATLASRVERLAPGTRITREELVRGLALDRAEGRTYARDSLRVYIDQSSLQNVRTKLMAFLLQENFPVTEKLSQADVYLTANIQSALPAGDAGILRILLYSDTILSSATDGFAATIDISFDTEFQELGSQLLRLSLDRGQIYGVPDLPEPFLLRTEVIRNARFAILASAYGIFLEGPPGIGKRTLATYLGRSAFLRRHFQGGIYWGIPNTTPSGPVLYVVERQRDTWPAFGPEDRLLVLDTPDIETDQLTGHTVPPLTGDEATVLLHLHLTPEESRGPIINFAAGNPGLLRQAARATTYFGWRPIRLDFRLLKPSHGQGLLDLCARLLPAPLQQKVTALSILGTNPPPSRELAAYVSGGPIPPELLMLGIVREHDGDLLLLANPPQDPGEDAQMLHTRVIDWYRDNFTELFPARIPEADRYYWQYIRHHANRAGDTETLARLDDGRIRAAILGEPPPYWPKLLEEFPVSAVYQPDPLPPDLDILVYSGEPPPVRDIIPSPSAAGEIYLRTVLTACAYRRSNPNAPPSLVQLNDPLPAFRTSGYLAYKNDPRAEFTRALFHSLAAHAGDLNAGLDAVEAALLNANILPDNAFQVLKDLDVPEDLRRRIGARIFPWMDFLESWNRAWQTDNEVGSDPKRSALSLVQSVPIFFQPQDLDKFLASSIYLYRALAYSYMRNHRSANATSQLIQNLLDTDAEHQRTLELALSAVEFQLPLSSHALRLLLQLRRRIPPQSPSAEAMRRIARTFRPFEWAAAVEGPDTVVQNGDVAFPTGEEYWIPLPAFENALAFGRYPVTVREYLRYLTAVPLATPPPDWSSQIIYPLRPVVNVSWYEAEAYCRWANCRLPTEGEWLYAELGPEPRRFPWGDDPPDEWQQTPTSVRTLPPVGIYPNGDTPDGLADMAGYVAEWTATESQNDLRVVLGHGRIASAPDTRNGNLGFRCARPPEINANQS